MGEVDRTLWLVITGGIIILIVRMTSKFNAAEVAVVLYDVVWGICVFSQQEVVVGGYFVEGVFIIVEYSPRKRGNELDRIQLMGRNKGCGWP